MDVYWKWRLDCKNMGFQVNTLWKLSHLSQNIEKLLFHAIFNWIEVTQKNEIYSLRMSIYLHIFIWLLNSIPKPISDPDHVREYSKSKHLSTQYVYTQIKPKSLLEIRVASFICGISERIKTNNWYQPVTFQTEHLNICIYF